MVRVAMTCVALLCAWAPMAQALDSEPAMLRTCVETFEGDPAITVALGGFCSCYVGEILRDAEEKPELYTPSEKKAYYSSKEEKEKMASVVSLMQGHEDFCVKMLEE